MWNLLTITKHDKNSKVKKAEVEKTRASCGLSCIVVVILQIKSLDIICGKKSQRRGTSELLQIAAGG